MTPSQTATIIFGGSRINYHLQHSDRKKTVSIAVDPREGVLVTAPQDLDAEHVHRIVLRKAGWIAYRLRDLQDINGDAYDREFVSGESFPYLGRNYRLKVIPRASLGIPLRLLRGRFEVVVDHGLSITERRTTIRTELCHLIRHNHSSKFWKLLRTIMPDYAERRERLRREGWRFWFCITLHLTLV